MKMEIEHTIARYRQRRDALELFDVNCWIGPPLEPCFSTVEKTAALAEALLRYGIRRAVVSHTVGLRYGAVEGNRELLDAVGRHDSLFAAATLVPEMAEGGSWWEVLRSLIAARVRLVRMFPASHGFLLKGDYLGGLLETLEELRVPLLVWHTQTTWREIAEVCSRYPDLPVIVEGTGRKLFYDNRTYYALLERFSNLFLETHNLTNYLGLDDLVGRFGSARFVFGSYFPHQDPNSAVMPITDGGFSEADRRNIAGGNLQRLIAEVKLV